MPNKGRWTALITLATVFGGGAVLVSGPAYAATGASVSNGRLSVWAVAGQANRITVAPSGGYVVVDDEGDTITAGVGCWAVKAHRVRCLGAAILSVEVNSGDLDDEITTTVDLPATLRGGPGDDTLLGGAGDDTIYGGPGDDVLTGLAGEDWMVGGEGNDGMSGGDADDYFQGGPGDDLQNGGAGDDLFTGDFQQPSGVSDKDTFDGGPGTHDWVSYDARETVVTADPDGVADDGAAGEQDNIGTDVEELHGGQAADRLTASTAGSVLHGDAGDDILRGRAGPDSLYGESGDDVLYTNDTIAGNDSADGGAGTDSCTTDLGDTRAHCEP